jgi:CheY-like chemotaxis protein
VSPFSNGIEAIVAINTQQFDLILLDVDMRDIGCHEILDAIPAFLCTPVALMSNETNEVTLISHPRVHSLLAKPFSVECLYSLLRRFKPQPNGYATPAEHVPGSC